MCLLPAGEDQRLFDFQPNKVVKCEEAYIHTCRKHAHAYMHAGAYIHPLYIHTIQHTRVRTNIIQVNKCGPYVLTVRTYNHTLSCTAVELLEKGYVSQQLQSSASGALGGTHPVSESDK